jgi:hypothetical protein
MKKNTDYMAETFDCLAMTLEMPFKDTADTPVPEIGWSPGAVTWGGPAWRPCIGGWPTSRVLKMSSLDNLADSTCWTRPESLRLTTDRAQT